MTVAAPVSAGRPHRLPVCMFPTLVIALGSALFALAGPTHSEPICMTGAGVMSVGIMAVPLELALRGRLSRLGLARLLVVGILVVQGLHTVEHITQLVQYYALDRPSAQSLGVISQLNVEWVHFGWNWLSTAGVVLTMALGLRGRWMTGLLAFIVAHSSEHTYMLLRYLLVTRKLDDLGLPRYGASEVLPGFFGRDGWLSLHAGGLRPYLGPFAATPRVTVHFWWNVGEMLLLAAVAIWAARSANPLSDTTKDN